MDKSDQHKNKNFSMAKQQKRLKNISCDKIFATYVIDIKGF